MTATDLATCRRFCAALAALDPEAALADSHPEMELHTPRETLQGAAGLRMLLAPPPLEYVERTIIVDDVIDAGGRAVALGRIQLRWRDADAPCDIQHVGAVLDLRDGRVICWQAFPRRGRGTRRRSQTRANAPASRIAERRHGISGLRRARIDGLAETAVTSTPLIARRLSVLATWRLRSRGRRHFARALAARLGSGDVQPPHPCPLMSPQLRGGAACPRSESPQDGFRRTSERWRGFAGR